MCRVVAHGDYEGTLLTVLLRVLFLLLVIPLLVAFLLLVEGLGLVLVGVVLAFLLAWAISSEVT